MYSLPTLSSLCPKKRKMKKSMMGFFRLLGHLNRQEECPKKGHSLTKTGTRCYHHTSSVHFNRGSPPPSISIQHGGPCFPWKSKSRQKEFCWNPGSPNLKTWRPCTTTSKKVETNFQQEGPSLWISRDLMLKKTLSSQPDYRGKWIPNYEDPCAITPVTTHVEKPTCRCSQEILCQKK